MTNEQRAAIRRARSRCYIPASSHVEPHADGSGYTTIPAREHICAALKAVR